MVGEKTNRPPEPSSPESGFPGGQDIFLHGAEPGPGQPGSDPDAAQTPLEPVVEELPSQRVAKWLAEQASSGDQPLDYSPEDVHGFRPVLRPPVAVLTVLDDGSDEEGERFRLRGDTFTIGRTTGDANVPNDMSMSGQHAEIRRTVWKGGFQWYLVDSGSQNGTLVRCVRAILHENAILLLGARRFRVRNPLRPAAVPDVGPVTQLMEGVQMPETVWPVLAEASSKPGALRFPLRSESMTIGRAGGGADIQLDDPLLANRHARLERRHDGSWLISAEHTRNGIWVSVTTVLLNTNCYFRCGEQQFRFVLP